MTVSITRREMLLTTAAVAAMSTAAPGLALAQTVHEIQMYNKHPDDKKKRNVFLPLVQVVKPGDTVKFIAADKGHNSFSLDDMMPEGAATWKGKINEEIEITFDKPGYYGYGCTPHLSLGMVGLIIVEGEGMNDNLEAAKAVKHRGKAKGVWKDIWAEVDGLNLGS